MFTSPQYLNKIAFVSISFLVSRVFDRQQRELMGKNEECMHTNKGMRKTKNE
jgi:hypothetical protein